MRLYPAVNMSHIVSRSVTTDSTHIAPSARRCLSVRLWRYSVQAPSRGPSRYVGSAYSVVRKRNRELDMSHTNVVAPYSGGRRFSCFGLVHCTDYCRCLRHRLHHVRTLCTKPQSELLIHHRQLRGSRMTLSMTRKRHPTWKVLAMT